MLAELSLIRSRIFSINYSSLSDLGLVPGVISNLLSLPSLLLPLSSSLLPFSLSPFSPPFPLFFPSPQHEKIAKIGNNFVLWGCLSGLSGLVHFLRRNSVAEDPAQCVYQAVDCVTAQAVDLTEKGGVMHGSWEDDTRGSTDRRTPLLDNLSFSHQSLHHTMTSRSTV